MDQPTYYSILPAAIRYDNTLTDGEKLLYSEVTALSNKNGICTAPNSYFAKLYRVTTETISRRVSKLVKKGYITVDFDYVEGTKEIEKRLIKITDVGVDKNINRGIDTNVVGGIDENVKDNNTSINIKKIYKKRKVKSTKNIEEDIGEEKEPKNIFGSLENVLLTENELIKLKERFTDYEDRIESLSLYMCSHGKNYKNHYATILAWDRLAKKKQQEININSSKKEERAYGTYLN